MTISVEWDKEAYKKVLGCSAQSESGTFHSFVSYVFLDFDRLHI